MYFDWDFEMALKQSSILDYQTKTSTSKKKWHFKHLNGIKKRKIVRSHFPWLDTQSVKLLTSQKLI